MGYVFLVLALLCGLVKAYCGKRSSHAATSSYDAILINTVRMSLCILIGLLLVCMDGSASIRDTTPQILLIALLGGVSTACFIVSWLLAVHSMAYMLVEVFVLGGTLLPLTLCAIRYEEAIAPLQILGIALLLVAVYCMCTDKQSHDRTGGRLSAKGLLLLLACAASAGCSDFSQKLYVKECSGSSVALLNLYIYLFAAGTLLIALPVFRAQQKKKAPLLSPLQTVRPIVHYVVIMAVCLFLNSYFKTLAAGQLDAVLLYPLSQGLNTVCSLGMSFFLFKEKIHAKGLFGIALSVVAMILINLCGA